MFTRNRNYEFTEKTCSFIQQSKDLGCKNFVLHGSVRMGCLGDSEFKDFYEEDLKFLTPVVEYAKKLGVVCLLENGSYSLSSNLSFCEITSVPFYHIKLSKELGLGLVVDLGHAALSARWFNKTLNELLISYFESSITPIVVHLSDNFLENDDHVAIGEGKADVGVFSRVLTL
ncbi:MAG: hypothetical protein A2Y09_05350 [Planctomycetes bacterium GWA2_39_15]|nr:MAG: hypothetical protein A2Y09_05350 [Planctomycetes bacterium GWA2_39_15]